MLTQIRLKQLYSYDSSTGLFTTLESRCNRAIKGTIPLVNANGYYMIQIEGKKYMQHRLAWLYIHGEFPKFFIDHINGNRKDNRISNLRECTKQQNQYNIGKLSNNKSGFKGVSYVKENGNYRARIRIGDKNVHLGVRNTPEEASILYEIAAAKVHKEFYYKAADEVI